MSEINLTDLLDYINPSECNYQEWINVGMALHAEGYACSVWDSWSSKDSGRYHRGECEKKWSSFGSYSGAGVSGATITQMAKENGWTYRRHDEDHELDWDDIITDDGDDLTIINKNWVELKEIDEPQDWNPVEDLIKYLETLFQPDEIIGYVTDTWQNNEGKYLPSKGSYTRTASDIIRDLKKYNNINDAVGDYKEEVGAWIRFNPLDGNGVKNDNVTEFRYALVESDTMDLTQQNTIIRDLELPVACLVHSGKKSIHAIVKVDAASYEEYRKRVDFIYDVCKKNGLKIDTANRNPSRLSRMPGVLRNGHKQFLIATNIGKENFDEWKEWIEAANDNLPDPESLSDVWIDMPPLADPLIDGILRKGHKLLLAGPSKAGKSFALIELCCAIAEGRHWLGWKCAQGKILYVNLELDRASCLHRFHDVYEKLGWRPQNVSNIDIWNLRGASMPMDQLAKKLIRRAQKKDYIAVIIDPIYKVITGDENSADQMAHFCNQFDKVCTELGCAVIYCHHHSKGHQGDKRSMDRASGSGVFARDPDALIDLIELEITDALAKQQRDSAACKIICDYLNNNVPDWEDSFNILEDDKLSFARLSKVVENNCSWTQRGEMQSQIFEKYKELDSRTAWRIEGTLREFPKFPPINLWFSYPVHHIDDIGVLADLDAEGTKLPWQKAMEKRKDPEVKKKKRQQEFENAFEAVSSLNDGGEVTVQDLVEYLGCSASTVWRRVRESDGTFYSIKNKGKDGKQDMSFIRKK